MSVLHPANVPPSLRHLIPLADHFGVTDDVQRQRLVTSASTSEVARLKTAVQTHDDDLDDWLAGPEADGPSFSVEYLAFSAMRMAADSTFYEAADVKPSSKKPS